MSSLDFIKKKICLNRKIFTIVGLLTILACIPALFDLLSARDVEQSTVVYLMDILQSRFTMYYAFPFLFLTLLYSTASYPDDQLMAMTRYGSRKNLFTKELIFTLLLTLGYVGFIFLCALLISLVPFHHQWTWTPEVEQMFANYLHVRPDKAIPMGYMIFQALLSLWVHLLLLGAVFHIFKMLIKKNAGGLICSLLYLFINILALDLPTGMRLVKLVPSTYLSVFPNISIPPEFELSQESKVFALSLFLVLFYALWNWSARKGFLKTDLKRAKSIGGLYFYSFWKGKNPIIYLSVFLIILGGSYYYTDSNEILIPFLLKGVAAGNRGLFDILYYLIMNMTLLYFLRSSISTINDVYGSLFYLRSSSIRSWLSSVTLFVATASASYWGLFYLLVAGWCAVTGYLTSVSLKTFLLAFFFSWVTGFLLWVTSELLRVITKGHGAALIFTTVWIVVCVLFPNYGSFPIPLVQTTILSPQQIKDFLPDVLILESMAQCWLFYVLIRYYYTKKRGMLNV